MPAKDSMDEHSAFFKSFFFEKQAKVDGNRFKISMKDSFDPLTWKIILHSSLSFQVTQSLVRSLEKFNCHSAQMYKHHYAKSHQMATAIGRGKLIRPFISDGNETPTN